MNEHNKKRNIQRSNHLLIATINSKQNQIQDLMSADIQNVLYKPKWKLMAMKKELERFGGHCWI